jgi:hypothetical protein
VERRFCDRPLWSALLSGLALLGLLVLPIDYRGGSVQPHAHSLLQLIVDSGDGHFSHVHAGSVAVDPPANAKSWFDPVADPPAGEPVALENAEGIDSGQQHGSVATYSSIPFLLVAAIVVAAPVGARREAIVAAGRLIGRSPRLPLPPPRLAVAA